VSLKQRWGAYINEANFSIRLLRDILAHCNLYHPELIYTTFERTELKTAKAPSAATSSSSSSAGAQPRHRSSKTHHA
jgi:hypothetical protein